MTLYENFRKTANLFLDKKAVNDLSFSDLLHLIDNHEYRFISTSSGENIIIDILHASKVNLPLVIKPKYLNNDLILPKIRSEQFELYMYSSGSSGKSKPPIRIPESMILANCEIASKSQDLTYEDNILTICSLNHTGGLNAQTIPGLLAGSTIHIKNFNAFTFFKDLIDYNITKTHLIPIMIDSLIKLNSFKDNKLKLVVAGSDCIKKEHVKFFIDHKIPFMCNYGLTEAGPIIINHTFHANKELDIFDLGFPLGDKCWTDYKIEDDELVIKGKSVYVDDWFKTGDCIEQHKNWVFYKGRKSHGCKIIPKKYRI